VSHAIRPPACALFDLPDVHVLSVKRGPRSFTLVVETVPSVVGCPGCGVLATGHGRGKVLLRDLPCAGVPVRVATDGWGADVVFVASGSPHVFGNLWEIPAPGGTVVLVGIPVDPVPLDVAAAQARELRIETVFRYANSYQRAIELAASPAVDLGALISATYPFEDAVAAFERGAEGRPTDTKIQVRVAGF
jgi:threonine dehydrogenase-like Zn-dependent dehydrogenase